MAQPAAAIAACSTQNAPCRRHWVCPLLPWTSKAICRRACMPACRQHRRNAAAGRASYARDRGQLLSHENGGFDVSAMLAQCDDAAASVRSREVGAPPLLCVLPPRQSRWRSLAGNLQRWGQGAGWVVGAGQFSRTAARLTVPTTPAFVLPSLRATALLHLTPCMHDTHRAPGDHNGGWVLERQAACYKQNAEGCGGAFNWS